MAHKADCGFAVVIFRSRRDDCIRDGLEIRVTGQQRFADDYLFQKNPLYSASSLTRSLFQTIHQMGRLNDQIFDTVISGAVQRLANVVNHFAIAVLDVVKDDFTGKAAAYRVVRNASCRLSRWRRS